MALPSTITVDDIARLVYEMTYESERQRSVKHRSLTLHRVTHDWLLWCDSVRNGVERVRGTEGGKRATSDAAVGSRKLRLSGTLPVYSHFV